jgi:uncharacterized Tic20 family protein
MVKVGRKAAIERSVFGDAALLLFLVTQMLDGVLTYVGVSIYGLHVEGNPLIVWLMATMGEGPAVTTAKVAAGSFGIALHLSAVHKAVAMLAAFYLAVAVLPWIAVFFYLG